MKFVLSEKKILFLSLTLIVLTALPILYLLLKEESKDKDQNDEICTTIEVQLNDKDSPMLVNNEQVKNMVKKFNVLKRPMKSILAGDVEKYLRRKGLFQTVEVYKMTEKICVDVTLKTPFFLVQPTKGKAYYVVRERDEPIKQDSTKFSLEEEEKSDPNKQIIPFQKQYQAIKTPIVTGFVKKEYAVNQLYDLLMILDTDPYFKDYFGHIYMDKNLGLILRPKFCNTDIIFGDATNWQEMLHKLRVFEEEVIKRKSWAKFEYLKFNFQNQIIAKTTK